MNNPVELFREHWPSLAAYYLVATLALFALRKILPAPLVASVVTSRLILAGILALVFTPSVVSDFWLFELPGPALEGLFMAVIAGLLNGAILKFVFLQFIFSYYLLPLCAGFALAYAVLWTHSHLRRAAAAKA